jgi:hypothetical protein
MLNLKGLENQYGNIEFVMKSCGIVCSKHLGQATAASTEVVTYMLARPVVRQGNVI